jgi:hypothetical protein
MVSYRLAVLVIQITEYNLGTLGMKVLNHRFADPARTAYNMSAVIF